MSTAELRAWLQSLADCEALVPAAKVLERLPAESETPAPVKREAEPDKLLTVGQLAARLGVHKSWCYRHSASLPFTKRLTSGALRFSLKGLERWEASR